MNDRVFSGKPDRLRTPERIALLEVDRVVELAVQGLAAEMVLDAGTGGGLFVEAFAKHRLRVAGTDSGGEMVELQLSHLVLYRFEKGE